MSEFLTELTVAIACAREAGHHLRNELHRPGGPRGAAAKCPADDEAEAIIRDQLEAAFPDDAIIGEELGFVGSSVVIFLFVIFIWLGILVVIRCKDRFGQLLAGGIVLAIGIQAALNLGVVTVVLPTKGIPLPFVSSGGTSLLLSSVAVGVLINIAKQTAKEVPEEIPQ